MRVQVTINDVEASASIEQNVAHTGWVLRLVMLMLPLVRGVSLRELTDALYAAFSKSHSGHPVAVQLGGKNITLQTIREVRNGKSL